jgi:beta-1,4-mannosyltransferase
MSVCYFISLLRGSQLVIDWHNYGYTILALGLGPHHPLVRVYRFYEKFCGRLSAANICVTDAMRRDLLANWNVRAATMHDRPPEIFRSLSLEEKHRLFCKLHIFKEENAQSSNEETTLFTVRDRTEKDDKARFRTDRPVLLVSSTSWTEDEDFSILLSALDRYDQFSQTERSDFVAPKIICVITGKGPQKEFYMNEIRSRHWSQVTVHTPWLEAQDYPALLGCADLGVCLHKSSSGLDLPMKVVDMFGCGLPVCAVNFDCLDELVKNGENGLIFHNAEELTNQLLTLLKDFPHGCSELKRFRENLGTFQRLRWSECWTENVLPVFS